MNTKKLAGLIAGALTLAAVPAMAQHITYDGRPERLFRPVSGLNDVDMRGIKDAAIANRFEVEASKIALRNGSGAWTREFAKEMIADHTAAQNELKEVAAKKGVALPAGLPMALRDQLAKLDGLHGRAFDAAYRNAQIQGHQMTEARLKADLRGGHDQDVRGYIVKTLPAVAMHLHLAKMRKTMMGPTKMQNNM